eukprot:CAMPEP_0194777268 /NCGR_PEP_ID=MMETSP0323_2-20130528/65240_1 /TAXON_ID=2866 ORGANISM="Crypthecodinium cohnii, Strain Seligo" /NCGR_SAMPLE_ID=MMETSP0323_2 /ASSEMBLY_ACC=CAM_ASM_000346 /LENGTH=45 /DNA_ID= /DNA_START= /DNA_END= /DNA_ORIENTATION=
MHLLFSVVGDQLLAAQVHGPILRQDVLIALPPMLHPSVREVSEGA